MAVEKKKPQVKKPERLDLKKARVAVKRMVEENTEWLKEMAKR